MIHRATVGLGLISIHALRKESDRFLRLPIQ